MNCQLKALLFGIDGLVSNINQINFTVWQKVLRSYGYENLTFQEYLQLFLFEHPSHVLIVLLPYCTVEEHNTIIDKKEEEFVRMISSMEISQFHISPGLQDFIVQSLKTSEELKIVAVSDLSVRETNQLLAKTGLNGMFDCILSSYGLKKSKPSPMIFEKAIEMLQLKPEQLFVFEGTIEGIISAHGANLSVIGIKPNLTDSREDIREEQRRENASQMILEHAKCVVDDFRNLKFEYLNYF